jgi:heptosyltransferase III
MPSAASRLIIHPGSGSPAKNWPLARWGSVVRTLRLPCTIITGEAEEARLGEILDAMRSTGVSVTSWHALPLRRLITSLQQAADTQTPARFLGHDSGPLHLAAACGLTGLALFGPTDPDVWLPLGSRIRPLRAPSGRLEDVSVDDVLSAWTA